MSYGIVRIQKFKAEAVKGIQIHDHRERQSRTNPDIDKERTPQNYSLVESENWNEAIKARIETLESTKAVRKDAVVMVQVLVTSDHEYFKNLTPEKEKAFFQESLKFIQERYGKENVFSAVVHKDEKTPHMHVNLTPIRDRRLTAKEVFNRQNVTSLHTDFFEAVGKKWGLERGQSREEKRKHLDTEEFKQHTRREQLQARMAEMHETGIWLKPEDVEPKVLKKSLLSTIVEAPEAIAKRVNESFIRPMAEKANTAFHAANSLRKENADLRQEVGEMRGELSALRAFMQEYGGTLKPEQQKEIREHVNRFKNANAVEKRQKEAELERQIEGMAAFGRVPDRVGLEKAKALKAQLTKDKGIER